jgi:deazaflavin-dependent oxidoreductase (nitroreductase family)
MTNVNEQVVAEFRARAGVVVEAMGGHFKDIRLLLLHTTGRRSCRHYITPLVYIEDADRYIVAGSNAGADQEPAWVANVAAMPEVVIEVGKHALTTKPTILREGPERDRLHAAMVAYSPDIREYETLTTRKFPLIVLDPVGS